MPTVNDPTTNDENLEIEEETEPEVDRSNCFGFTNNNAGNVNENDKFSNI